MRFVIVNVVVVDVSLPRRRNFDDSINIICKFKLFFTKTRLSDTSYISGRCLLSCIFCIDLVLPF